MPENDIAYFRREQLTIAPEARVTLKGGTKRTMTEADLDRILATCRAQRRRHASAWWPAGGCSGEPLGPHKYHGTRTDDPNDVFPHEHRRELRGLRVFCGLAQPRRLAQREHADMFVPPRAAT